MCSEHLIKARSDKKKAALRRKAEMRCRNCPNAVDAEHTLCRSCIDLQLERDRSIRLEALTAYCDGNTPKCACCGEGNLVFLTLDHIKRDGAEHRKVTGGAGPKTYRSLRQAGFPPGFRVLCWSCNSASYINDGICPHIRKVDKPNTYHRRHREKIRKRLFESYGYNCYCCGESKLEFLTIDHIAGGGNKHTQEAKQRNLYLLIHKEDYPPGKYRTACYNCNCGSSANGGICPHQESSR